MKPTRSPIENLPNSPKAHAKSIGWRLHIIKMAILPKLVHRLKAISDFFVETNALILKFIWNYRLSGPSKTKENKVGGLTDFKTNYKGMVIKAV